MVYRFLPIFTGYRFFSGVTFWRLEAMRHFLAPFGAFCRFLSLLAPCFLARQGWNSKAETGGPERTKPHQTAPQNEILKVARLPGEGGKLHPGNPEQAARQNPDVKERPRAPRGNPHPPPARQCQRHRRLAASRGSPN